MNKPTLQASDITLWQRLLAVALTGAVPLFVVSIVLIRGSYRDTIAFTQQEVRGNAFLRPLEQVLELVPTYEAAWRAPKRDAALKDLRGQIDDAMAAVSSNYNGALGRALNIAGADAWADRGSISLEALQSAWKRLAAATTDAAADQAAAELTMAVRRLIARTGDLSNLILDDHLDSYYLMDITVNALPQTQQRLADLTLHTSAALRRGDAATHATGIAVELAMLRQSDEERIIRDSQTSLNEDRSHYGASSTLQKNLPPAIARYRAANDAFAALLQRVVDGNAVDPDALEAAGWKARAESFQLWRTGVAELDQLLLTRIATKVARKEQAYVSICITLAVVGIVMAWLIRNLVCARYFEVAKTEEQLRSNEERLRTLGDNLPNSAVYQVLRKPDGSMQFLYISAGVERLNGISAEAMMQDYDLFMRQVLPEDVPKLAAARAESMSSKQQLSVVVRIRRTDGELRWMRYMSAPHALPDGSFMWDGIQTDITPYIKAEEQLKRLNRTYAVVSRINHVIVHEKDSQAMLESACRIAVEEGKFRMAWIGLIDDAAQELRAVAWSGVVEDYPALKKFDLSNARQSTGPIARCINYGQQAICNNIATDPFYEAWRDEAMRRGYHSSGGFPLKVGGRVIGVFSIYASEPGFFDDDEVRLLSGMAEDISFALEVNRLETERQKTEAALKQSEARFFHIFKISPIPITLSRFADMVIVDTNDSFLRMSGFTREEVIGRTSLELNVYPEPTDRARIMDTVRAQGHLHHHQQKFRTKSGEIRENILWFNLVSISGEDYLLAMAMDETERLEAERRLESTTRQMRALAARLQTLREDERTRLARDIHDHLGQLLTALNLDLHLIEKKAAAVADPELREALTGKISSARILTNETISAVQKIATEMRPAVLDRMGLEAAIESEAQAFQERTGVRCRWTLPPSPLALAPEQSTAIFRIFQELLTNVARHAQASNVGVRLAQRNGTLLLEVNDDGVGINAGEIDEPGSLGLLGIKERVAQLGGAIAFQPNGETGTAVTVKIPIHHETGPVT